jgi:uncharacterized protein (DUF58 family)
MAASESMTRSALIEESDLHRFARLAAPYLQRAAVSGQDPRAPRDRPGSGLEFLDLRDYQAGDDIRHIDWRQTARRRRPVVRRFRSEAAADWFICVDSSASVCLHPDKWTMTVRLASALAYTCLYAGQRVAMLIFSDRITGRCDLGRGAHQYPRLLKLLLAQSTDKFAAPKKPRLSLWTGSRKKPDLVNQSNLGLCRDYLSANSNVFVISDFLQSDGMQTQLQSIRSSVSSAGALQVLAESEIDVPATGITRLRDVESGQEQQVVLSDQAKRDAGSALLAHQENLRNDCTGLGIRFTSCRSNRAWQQTLLEHLRV